MESKIKDKAMLQGWRQTEAEWEQAVLDPTKHKKLRNPYLLDKSKGKLSRSFTPSDSLHNASSQDSPRSSSLT